MTVVRRIFFRNSIASDFAQIDRGEFVIGSPVYEKCRDDNETQHKVTLTKGYYLGLTAVTRGEYAAFVQATGYRTDAEDIRAQWHLLSEAGGSVLARPRISPDR